MWAKLKLFFSNRWVLSALGLLIIALLIWFAGDAIAIYDRRPLGSAGARIGLIALIVLAFAAWEGFKRWRAWRANRAMLAALTSGGEASNSALSQREVAELKKRFDDAMQTLRTARFDDKSGRRNYLYQLPWYMFIGAPGSGKTTALINSGLRFPLSEKQGGKGVEIKGVGGTRNCDWWFTDEAVLLDTAGRYTTQSSNQEVDAAAWSGFLALLKRFRPRQPLNGAIITLSISDLLTQSAEQRAEYAREVRARIQELYKTLGLRFPLYVMVTKCDLIAGFTEYCSDMGREARAQVWGMTFPFKPNAKVEEASAQFDAEFDALVQRLNGRLFARMEEERDPAKRATLFAFPQQFAGVKGLCKSFLEEVFQSSAFAESPMLRGVYFTSGTQEGSPIDRVLGNISRAFGLERQLAPPASGSGRSFFLTRLLRDVVFGESDLGGRSAEIERRRGRIAMAGYAVLALVSISLLAGWTVSFVRNQALVSEVEKSAAELAKLANAVPKLPLGDVRVALPALEALNLVPGGPASRDADVPLTLGLGLYQGHKLGAQAGLTYANLLRDAFMPRVALRLEQQIREAESPEVRYEALKAYLMLYDAKHLGVEELEAWITADWSRNSELRADQARLATHLHAALTQQPLEAVLPINRALVDDARRQLAAASLPERAYSRLKRLGVTGVPDFKLNEAAGPSAALVFTRSKGKPLTDGVPAMFTINGYNKVFYGSAKVMITRLANEESWVLGPQASGGGLARVPKVLEDVQRLYLNEYMRIWDELLGDLRLLPTNELQASIQSMTLLAAGDSPLRQLLQAVARETRLASAPASSAEQAAGKLVDRAASSVREGIDRLLGDTKSANAPTEIRPEMVVEKHFEQLHRVVLAPAGTQAPLDAVLGVLKEYEVFLRANQEAALRGTSPQSDALIKARIKSEADRMPPPVSGILNGLVTSSGGQAAQAAKEGVQKQLAGQVAVLCRPAIEGRYPFVRSQQTKEVPLGDFSTLFKPGGMLDTFAKTSLPGLVDMSGPIWRALKVDGVVQVDEASVANFQRAAVIRDAFFAGGMPSPSIQADLILTKVDDSVSEVQFNVDGQVTKLAASGSSQGVRITWPSIRPAPQIRISLLGAKGAEGPAVTFDGAWALFRLVDSARTEGGTTDRLLLGMTVGDRKLQFELRSANVRNPLRLPELAQFRCPG